MIFKFFLASYSEHNPNYQHHAVALAEGFRELGVEYISSANHWYDIEQKKYLFSESDAFSYDVGIYTNNVLNGVDKIDKTKINVLLDLADGPAGSLGHRFVKNFDIVFKAHFLRDQDNLSNVKPWAFGFTTRQLKMINEYLSWGPRGHCLRSFRIDHTLRSFFGDKELRRIFDLRDFVDSTEAQEFPSYNAQTGNRHSKSYFKAICDSQYVLSYGGYLVGRNDLSLANRTKRKIRSVISPSSFPVKEYTIYQYDSFRFWEVLISSAIPVHVDFDLWGFNLPVIPKRYHHYLPIDLSNNKVLIDFIADAGRNELNEISKNGREWALNYYSPVNVAKRFLSYVDGSNI